MLLYLGMLWVIIRTEVHTDFNGDVKFLRIFCFDILIILKKELEHLNQGIQDVFIDTRNIKLDFKWRTMLRNRRHRFS